MARVRQLPPQLADKIAAGEVVERPASVVKELAENSLDAGADRIQTTIQGGGLKSIRISDNGQGMDEEDARLSIKRHATSKIQDEADLFQVRTMGFRGEALPAIASVSRLELLTRTAAAQEAVKISMEGGDLVSLTQAAGPVGTSVTVADLFYNTPARLKFVKTKKTETAWIKETLFRLALAHPKVGFQLRDDEKELLDLEPVQRMTDRLSEAFGREETEALLRVREDHPAVRVEGWISPAHAARSSSGGVYLFVNGRFIRDKTVLNGLLAGYQGRLERGRYPLAVIFLEMEPGTLDVNVHPAKLEVRLHHAQAVRQAVVRAVSKALTTAERFIWTGPKPAAQGLAVKEGGFSPDRPGGGWSGPSAEKGSWSSRLQTPRFDYRPPSFRSPEGAPPEQPNGADEEPRFRYLGTYGGVYLVGQVDQDLVVIDQHAAHERIIYEKLVKGPVQSQSLLTPEKITLDPVQADWVRVILDQTASFGFVMEPFDPDGRTFLIKALPAILGTADPCGAVLDLIAVLREEGPEADAEAIRLALARVACHAAVRAGQEMSRPEVDCLVRDLGELTGPLTCPHGRPLIKRFSRAELDRWFKRI